MDDLDFAEFWRVMPMAMAMRGRPGVVEAVASKFHREISSVLVALLRLGIVGPATLLHPDPPTSCDECDQSLAANDWFVDGANGSGMWGNMCPACFWSEGEAIRYGAGQLYWKTSDAAWRLVAGGDPSLSENER